jgi:thiol-disulfide isomerase/thioredoxin
MASGGAVRDVGSPAELEAAVAGARAVAVHFWASWCEASKQMDEVFAHLAVDFPHAAFLRVRASALFLDHCIFSSDRCVFGIGSVQCR